VGVKGLNIAFTGSWHGHATCTC